MKNPPKHSVSELPLRDLLVCTLLLTLAFGLAAEVKPRLEAQFPERAANDDPLAVVFGGTRLLFANEFFTKADVYFHSGYYPTVFDDQSAFHTPHMAMYSGTEDLAKNDRAAAKRKPLVNVVKVDDADGSPGVAHDWIAEFSRNFYPVRHTHLNEVGNPGAVAEILPWLKISTELDPHKVEAYVAAAYWLCRPDLNQFNEADEFLREGLRANPDSCEILFELGRIQHENRHDAGRARNLWKAGLEKWETVEAARPDPNKQVHLQLLAHLARLEEQQGDFSSALFYLGELKPVSPSPDSIQAWMEKISAQTAAGTVASPNLPSALSPASIEPPANNPADKLKRREFSAQGVVKHIHLADREVIIAHQEITNYMVAMTMPFSVKDTNQLAGLKTGDAVSFRLIVLPDDEWIERIERIEKLPVSQLHD